MTKKDGRLFGVLSITNTTLLTSVSRMIIRSQTPSTKIRKGGLVVGGGPFDIASGGSNDDTCYCRISKPGMGGGLSACNGSTASTIALAGASVPNLVLNLIKNIVGAGVLGLPAGIAAFGDAPSAVLPALFLIILMGSMSAYGFSLIGRLCAYTKTPSYRAAWEVALQDTTTSWIPAVACMMVTCSLILSYSMILSRTVPDLILFAKPNLYVSPTEGLLGVTLMVLLPLCLLKDLKSLAPFSLIGISGMLYTNGAMTMRYLQGSYHEASVDIHTPTFLDDLSDEALPHFGNNGAGCVFSSDSLLLVSILSTAFSAHYNAPMFYWELEEPSLQSYKTVVATSFCVSMGIMALTTIVGFLTFGGASQGLILNNYATSDFLMTMSRFAVTLSLVCSYPLAFVGIRDGVLDFLQIPHEQRKPWLLNCATVVLLIIFTYLALEVHDLRVLFALKGATLGTATMYLFPSYMMLHYCRQQKALIGTGKMAQAQIELIESLEAETPWMMVNALLGFLMGCIGTYRALQIV
jgi:amino acid permease